jgi:hypothetical protein
MPMKELIPAIRGTVAVLEGGSEAGIITKPTPAQDKPAGGLQSWFYRKRLSFRMVSDFTRRGCSRWPDSQSQVDFWPPFSH